MLDGWACEALLTFNEVCPFREEWPLFSDEMGTEGTSEPGTGPSMKSSGAKREMVEEGDVDEGCA